MSARRIKSPRPGINGHAHLAAIALALGLITLGAGGGAPAVLEKSYDAAQPSVLIEGRYAVEPIIRLVPFEELEERVGRPAPDARLGWGQ